MNPSLQNAALTFVFNNIAQAESAVGRLIDAGADAAQIGVVCASDAEGLPQGVEQIDPGAELVLPAAVAGSALGGLLGGMGIVLVAGATTGLGLFVAGPVVGGATALGGLVGAMTARGGKPELSDFYEQALRRGEVLVLIAGEVDPRHAELLTDCGGRSLTFDTD